MSVIPANAGIQKFESKWIPTLRQRRTSRGNDRLLEVLGFCDHWENVLPLFVIPANAGIKKFEECMDSHVRGNDGLLEIALDSDEGKLKEENDRSVHS